MPFYFTAANATSLSFLNLSDAYSIDEEYLLKAIKTNSLSFYKFLDMHYNYFPFYFTAANATSLSFLKFSDAYSINESFLQIAKRTISL